MNTKLSILISALFIICSHAMADSDTPSWVQTIRQCSIIDSIVHAPHAAEKDSNFTIWHLYYHQPLCHEEPQGEIFQLRAILAIRNDVDPATAINEFIMTGYDVDTIWRNPGLFLKPMSLIQIAHHYHANFITPEHRYFSKSSPEHCWTRPEYDNADEASQDFHALLEALKTAFQGKWVMQGVSKGGIVTTMQHAFFPDDADVFVPNSAPFCKTITDPRLYRYYVNNAWEESTRNRYNAFEREMVKDSAAVTIFSRLIKDAEPDMTEYQRRKTYYCSITSIGFGVHAYKPRNLIDSIMDVNDKNRQYILEQKIDTVTNSYLNALMVMEEDLDATKAWEKYLPESQTAKGLQLTADDDSSITEEDWKKSQQMAYDYQAAMQLGYYDIDFHDLFTEPDDQQFADSLQEFYNREGAFMFFAYPFLRKVKYDDYALFSMVEQKTKEATKPVLFLYSQDDPWTGAQMGDEFINGDNVRKYVFPAQFHGTFIDKGTPELRQEVWAFLDKYLLSPTGIDEVAGAGSAILRSPVRKVIKEGRLIIQTTGKEYNTLGQEVR